MELFLNKLLLYLLENPKSQLVRPHFKLEFGIYANKRIYFII